MRKTSFSLIRWFNNLTIRFKMVILVVGITVGILVISFSLWTYFDHIEFKKVISEKLNVLAGTVGHNSRVAVVFRDEISAQEILASLHQDSKIMEAALYDDKGQKITHYLGKGISEFTPPLSKVDGTRFFDDQIEIILPVIFKEKRAGSIFLRYSLSGFKDRSRQNLITLILIGILALLFAFLAILKLQNLITRPLFFLADSAKNISQNQNYDLRIDYESEDEIGTLCKGFNDMLQQLKIREKELEAYRFNLEGLVIKRTAELVSANHNLKREIEERKSTEKKLNVSLSEKEILLKEINHRVKNNMQILSSLLSMQAKEIDDPGLLRKFEDSRLRISAMAQIHEHIFDSPDLTQIDLKEYIESLFDHQLQSFGVSDGRVIFKLDTELETLPVNIGMYLGLTVNELLSNSFKHAFPDGRKGNISMNIELADINSVALSYKDDGVGFSDIDNDGKKKTLGLRLLEQLIFGQLEGEMVFKSRKPLNIFISFPLFFDEE